MTCPSNWHVMGANPLDGTVTYTRSWVHFVDVRYADALAVHGDPADIDLECPTRDQVRRMVDDRQAGRRHPAIKPNRRRTHR